MVLSQNIVDDLCLVLDLPNLVDWHDLPEHLYKNSTKSGGSKFVREIEFRASRLNQSPTELILHQFFTDLFDDGYGKGDILKELLRSLQELSQSRVDLTPVIDELKKEIKKIKPIFC